MKRRASSWQCRQFRVRYGWEGGKTGAAGVLVAVQAVPVRVRLGGGEPFGHGPQVVDPDVPQPVQLRLDVAEEGVVRVAREAGGVAVDQAVLVVRGGQRLAVVGEKAAPVVLHLMAAQAEPGAARLGDPLAEV